MIKIFFLKDTPTVNTQKDCIIPFIYDDKKYNYCANIEGTFQCPISQELDEYIEFDECNNGNLYTYLLS